MAGSGFSLGVLLVVLVGVVEAQQFGLTHKYAHLESSPARTGSGANGTVSQEYFDTLVAHDRRRLASFVTFPLKGSFLTTSLYYTQISLGTPPRQYNVFVDTGSDLTWVNCAPCTNCPGRSTIDGVTLTQYDPARSSSENVLSCQDPDCQAASQTNNPVCDDLVSPNACPYDVQYLDGSGTNGYILSDVLTFNLVVNGTNTAGTANVYFGCGHNVSGNLQSGDAAVDGLMGLGTASVTIPNQIAPQKNTSRMFAHCLQGSDAGGGIIVMGNITEPGVVYTPMVPDMGHFNIGMQNIAVAGVNITTPSVFEVQPVRNEAGQLLGYTGGVLVDSGSTLGLLVQPAYDQFVAAISSNAAPGTTPINIPQRPGYTCFNYNGPVDEVFPAVTLFFDGGAKMELTGRNYMLTFQTTTQEQYAYCFAWSESTSYTILGDIVLQDQLVVHDIDNQRVGWIQNFNCSKSIAVGASTYTEPSAPSTPGGSGGFSSGPPASRMSIYSLCCSSLAVAAFLLSNLL